MVHVGEEHEVARQGRQGSRRDERFHHRGVAAEHVADGAPVQPAILHPRVEGIVAPALVDVSRVDVPVEQQPRRLAGAAQPDDDVGPARHRRVDVDLQARMVHELGDGACPRAFSPVGLREAGDLGREHDGAVAFDRAEEAGGRHRCGHGTPQLLKRRRTLRVMCETWSLTGSEQTQLIEPVENTAPPDAVSKVTISEPPSWGLMPLASRRVPGGL